MNQPKPNQPPESVVKAKAAIVDAVADVVREIAQAMCDDMSTRRPIRPAAVVLADASSDLSLVRDSLIACRGMNPSQLRIHIVGVAADLARSIVELELPPGIRDVDFAAYLQKAAAPPVPPRPTSPTAVVAVALLALLNATTVIGIAAAQHTGIGVELSGTWMVAWAALSVALLAGVLLNDQRHNRRGR